MRNKRKIIYWILLILWMSMIAIMSNQPASISDSQSLGVLNQLNSIGINISNIFGDLSNFIIRKTAHFLEYMILGILIYNVLNFYFDKKQIFYIAVVLSALYACTDEIHQFFVAGRECAFRDVVIDTCGALCGVLIKKHLKVKSTV